MKNALFCSAVLLLVTCVCGAAPQHAPQLASADQIQKFVVVHSDRFVASTLTLTNAEANCSIQTVSGAASMQCQPVGVSAKNYYHYNSALIVDGKGTAYVIACENSLIARWCKEFAARAVILGSMTKSSLAVADGDKTHSYVVLTSAYVGPEAAALVAQAPAAETSSTVVAAPPAATPKAAAPSRSTGVPGAQAGERTPNVEKGVEKASGDSSAACISRSGACVSFLSEPPGADIYVDDKFVGNTPSVITLSVGSHDIRMEAANRKPWTRKLETSAGSKITVRGTFEVPTADK